MKNPPYPPLKKGGESPPLAKGDLGGFEVFTGTPEVIKREKTSHGKT
jgi:hypothetical protein